ncbi:hypothetical protein HK096_005154, partial [Nowakowskiella sp. JEL0078]
MAARENSEADLLDLALRKLVFRNQTTYSFECGGKTDEILRLTRDDIRDYHSKFYDINNITVILTGIIDPNEVFQMLAMHPYLFETSRNYICQEIVVPPSENVDFHIISESVHFPSEDTEVGSIGYGSLSDFRSKVWRGPQSEDVFTCTALDVLLRYLNDSSASPLYQSFVERDNPFASDIDFELRAFTTSVLVLIFSGVPFFGKDDTTPSNFQENDIEMEDGSEEWYDEDDEDKSEQSEGEDMDETTDSDEDLFNNSIFHDKLMESFQNVIKNFDFEKMKASVRRHKRKCTEGVEEDPHETISGLMIPDIVRHHFSRNSLLNDTKYQGGIPKIGTRALIFQILDDLLDKPESFWVSLIDKYLLNQPVFEVKMIPDPKKASEVTLKSEEDHQKRLNSIGAQKLAELRTLAEKYGKTNLVDLPIELKTKMPRIPDISMMKRIALTADIVKSDGKIFRPFSEIQILTTDTSFVSLRIGLNVGTIPTSLLKYLVIFQEMLFQTDIIDLASSDSIPIIIDYRNVVERSSEILNSYEAAVGFGNELWHASWLEEIFFVCANTEVLRWKEMFRHIIKVLMFSQFTEERILTIAKNLSSELVELKRDGSEMLTAVTNQVTSAANRNLLEKSDTSDQVEIAISIFSQETVLKQIVKDIQSGKGNIVVQSLQMLQAYILGFSAEKILSSNPSFIQIAVPSDFPISSAELVEEFKNTWDSEFDDFKKFSEKLLLASSKTVTKSSRKEIKKVTHNRQKNKISSETPSFFLPKSTASAFPFPRKAKDPCLLLSGEFEKYKSVIVPLQGLSTTFLNQIVGCDVLNSEDFFP